MKKKATVEDIKDLVKILKKNKVKGPYYVEIENPKEFFDLFEGIKPAPRYTRVFKNITYKEREKIQKKIVKDMQKATDKRELTKGTVINCDTIRKGVKFLQNETKKNLKKDLKREKMLTDKNWNIPSYINYLDNEIEKLKTRIEGAEKIITNLSIEVNEHINR